VFKYLLSFFVVLAMLWSVPAYAYEEYEPNYDYISSCRFGPEPQLQSRDVSPNTLRVKAIFQARCTSCHGTQSPKFSNILDAKGLIDSGIVTPFFNPDQTVLYQSLVRDILRMPLGAAPLNVTELSYVREWIRDGAPDFFDVPGGWVYSMTLQAS